MTTNNYIKVYLLTLCFIQFISIELFSQNNVPVDKKEIPYNTYDLKYYYKGTPFSGIMKSDFNEITFKEGFPNGSVKSYNTQGKVYRSLNYINGKFEGNFFTEGFKGTFMNDTIVGSLEEYDRGKLYTKYNFSSNDNSSSKESIRYHNNGKISIKGIFMYYLQMSSFDMGININDFIEGTYFLNQRRKVNLPEMSRKDMYNYSTYYENGQLSHKQIVGDNSLLGYVQYHQNGIISDSLVSLLPLTLNNISSDEYLKSVRNRVYYKFNEKGKLIRKNTQIDSKQTTVKKDGDNLDVEFENTPTPLEESSVDMYFERNENGEVSGSGKFVGEYFDTYSNGMTMYKWKFNIDGLLDGEYLEYHNNGKLYIKTSFTKGELNPFLDFYRENGTKRLSVYKLNDEYIFEEYFIDGNVKLKHKIVEGKVKEFLGRLSSRLRITGEPSNEGRYLTEDHDLLNDLTEENTEEINLN